jgi:hypothetical protein
MERILDPGPISYHEIELYHDPDLEHALREDGLEPATTVYRLIEIPVASLAETRSMPWKHMGPEMTDALDAAARLPPIVVRADEAGWTLLDGAHRTHAFWTTGRSMIQAYELLPSGR